jgi:hypothetical protein
MPRRHDGIVAARAAQPHGRGACATTCAALHHARRRVDIATLEPASRRGACRPEVSDGGDYANDKAAEGQHGWHVDFLSREAWLRSELGNRSPN